MCLCAKSQELSPCQIFAIEPAVSAFVRYWGDSYKIILAGGQNVFLGEKKGKEKEREEGGGKRREGRRRRRKKEEEEKGGGGSGGGGGGGLYS